MRCSGWERLGGMGCLEPTPTHRPRTDARARELVELGRLKSLRGKDLRPSASRPCDQASAWGQTSSISGLGHPAIGARVCMVGGREGFQLYIIPIIDHFGVS